MFFHLSGAEGDSTEPGGIFFVGIGFPEGIGPDELPESEKDYDRRTSMETLKLLLKLGCRITME